MYVGKQERDYQRDRSVGNNVGKVRSLKERVAGICVVGEKNQFTLEKFVEKC